MRALLLSLVVMLPALWPGGSEAASMGLDRSDCASILERWANDPKSVPKRLVDQCKEQMAAIAPAAGEAAGPATAAALDPCSGPMAAGSVLCWGPWSALAPAAGPEPPGLYLGDDTVAGYDPRPELAGPFEPDVDPEPAVPPLPLGSCAPGAPCGFATIVDGVTSSADSEATGFRRFALAPDGSQFTVDPGGDDEIQSVTDMPASFVDRPDEYENLQASGRSGDEQSRLAARVIRDGEGDIEVAADVWTHGNRATRTARSGYFAWGNTTSQAGLNALGSQGATVSFSGPMSVDNSTVGTMTLEFGSQAGWSGSWTNPGYSFSAGGPLTGVDLVSDGNKFSANVLPDSVVQGALLGEPGAQSIAHIIDVNLNDKGRVRDVGLLRQVGTTPGSNVVAAP